MFLMKLIYSDGSFLRLPTAVQHSSKKEFTWAAQLMNWQLSLYYLLYLLLNCHRHVFSAANVTVTKGAGWLETQPATPTTAAHFKEDVSGLFFSVIPEKVRKWSWWPSLLLAQCHQMIHLIKEPIGYNEAWGKVSRWAQSILCCDLSSSSHQGSAVTKEHKDTWRVERFRKAGDPPPHTNISEVHLPHPFLSHFLLLSHLLIFKSNSPPTPHSLPTCHTFGRQRDGDSIASLPTSHSELFKQISANEGAFRSSGMLTSRGRGSWVGEGCGGVQCGGETRTCTHCTVQRAASSQLFVFCLWNPHTQKA